MLSFRRQLRPVFLVLFALGALVLPGCVPTAWLPDSSGFVYIKAVKTKNPGDPASGQILHYDLAKKTSRVVVDNIPGGTMWPAVSPDGKRVAIARFKGEPKLAKQVQITIYDLQGKQVHQSKELPWADADPQGGFSINAGMLFWSPKEDMIVVTDLSSTGVYNVGASKIKVMPKTMPAVHGGTPIRPDGKGFLAVVEEKAAGADKQSRLVFIDWQGTEKKIDTSAFEKAVPKDKGGPGGNVGEAFVMGFIWPSGWEGNFAWVGFRRDKMMWQIDTVGKNTAITAKFAALLSQKDDPFKKEPMRYDFPGDVSVHLTQFQEDRPDGKGKRQYLKVTIVNHKTGKQDVVEAKVPGSWMFSPSPNGQYLNVGIGELLGAGPGTNPEPLHLLVISSKGQLHSKLTIEQ